MNWQLIVHHDEGVVEESRKAVEAALGPSANVIEERNFERAREKLERMNSPGSQCTLVVIGAETPETRYSKGASIDAGPARGFVRGIKKMYRDLPVVALTATPCRELSGLLSAYDDAALIVFASASAWRDELQLRVSNWATHFAPGASGTAITRDEHDMLELQITFGRNGCKWYLATTGRISDQHAGSLFIKSGAFDDLVKYSEELAKCGDTDNWRNALDKLATELRVALSRGSTENEDFRELFGDMKTRVGGIQNSRIVFHVEDDAQAITVEALRDLRKDGDFLMLKAPFIREYGSGNSSQKLLTELSQKKGSINCLVVVADPEEGDISDEKSGWQGYLPSLDHAAVEGTSIAKLFTDAKNAGSEIGKVKVLQLDRRLLKDDVATTLKDCLKDETWHLVHFVGHGVINSQDTAGLVLGAYPGGVLPFHALISLLGGIELLFVSSCHSAHPAFLQRAIENLVPAVLGYRWSVKDHGAAAFARAFYNALFKEGARSFQSLEYAFLEARCAIFKDFPEDATWASPSLIRQLSRRRDTYLQ